MSNSGAKKTKSAKTQKAVNKEFDKVINQLEKENEAFQTPHSHMVMFAIASLLAAGAPVVLYTTNSLYDGKAETRLAWFGAIWAATAAILCLTYNALATSTRKKLLLSREAAVGVPGDRADKEVKVVTANEAAYYALAAVNLLYVAVFALCTGYLLPSQELSPGINFLIASGASAAFAAAAVSVRAL
mmetsp:Transcript_6649/g.14562  ORF Transcript_6649/g.14562 Transcript_6649/m.14562 type:complete len:187 (+) Transcript_6649:86-646(+)|eukprot:CAMPEP_0173235564 /NCGR_PEP_ID=MMETSP1142-20121109/10924_1 /TAXON_ID=483371 /ORGANISM="non described non described, Strain CCMP2298" /LENGTH=186 /DNA_ID=CAMNT_0014165875 /DNA_START=49 /DNA_END=609 /DNA_ORIENTATION=-